MTEIAKALWEFWNSFGIDAGMSDTLLDNPDGKPKEPPYLLYQVQKGETFGELPDYIQLFEHRQNKEKLYALADKISEKISDAIALPLPSGRIIVITEIAWQDKPDTENTVALYGSFIIHY